MMYAAALLILSSGAADASMIVRTPPEASFLEAPAGRTHGLFVPAVHECNRTFLKEYLKKYPEQGKKDEKSKAIEEGLGVVHDILEENGLPTILEGGSTLGFFRNCGVIPGDHDGDVALLGNWLTPDKIDALKKSFATRGHELADSLCPGGPSQSGCELRAYLNNSYVDLLVYASQDECTQAPCNFFSSLWSGGSTEEGYFYPCDTGPIHFEQASFLERTFWIQAPSLDYLKGQYGEVWQDPTGGIYKSCHFDKKNTPEPDSKAGMTPPADYVVMLQKESEKTRAQVEKNFDKVAGEYLQLQTGEKHLSHEKKAKKHAKAASLLDSGKRTVELRPHSFLASRS